tara:strand:+ start:780 stop:1082 length:303 start_codon:yes stop_codon:yes gene_type:complete
MTKEDEEFNRIEREADMRRKAISSALKDHQQHMLQYMSEYERGVIDGRSMQAKSSVDKAVNAMAQTVVPDAIHHTDLGETLEYIQGWNDCRAAMLEMRKP